MKNIYMIFLALLTLQGGLWFYFDKEMQSKSSEYEQKSMLINELNDLDTKWSKENQKLEVKRIYDFLGAFDIKYEVSGKKNKKTLSLHVSKEDSSKVISFILNRNIKIKEFKIDKIDNYTLRLVMDIV